MKKYINIIVSVALVSVLILCPKAQAQDKQYKARLSAEYHKVMGENPFLKIEGKFKGENGYEPTKKLTLNVYQELAEDSLVLKGQATTNMTGVAFFDLEPLTQVVDSVMKNTYVVKIEDSDRFKNGKKSVSFIDVRLAAQVVVKDSVNHIFASLTDATGAPLEGQKLSVTVKRLFAPLTIGKTSYKTDDVGAILVPIEESIPGVDGKLTFEVMIDSRKYGVVSEVFEAPIGTPIVDLSTFDQRTMWSPPTKTPLFLWIFPNLVILGIWGVIFLLVRNMYLIYKS
jgi:hypothetical protein